jgi:hypothetical protein
VSYGRGKVTGEKKERQGSTAWYREHEEEHIRKVEAEWAAKWAQQQAKKASANTREGARHDSHA